MRRLADMAAVHRIAPLVPAPTMSKRIWGFDWADHLPWQVDAVSVEVGSFALDALPFIESHYSRIFGGADATQRFLSDPMTDAKRRFGDEMDVLLFRAERMTIGLLIGHPLDWSTYYMRSVAILPEYRDRRLLTRIMEQTCEPLRAAGVERIEGDCSPANLPMMRMLTGLGFLVTAAANSERWGAMVRSTKFLREDAEDVFARQFCGMRVKRPQPSLCGPNSERRFP